MLLANSCLQQPTVVGHQQRISETQRLTLIPHPNNPDVRQAAKAMRTQFIAVRCRLQVLGQGRLLTLRQQLPEQQPGIW